MRIRKQPRRLPVCRDNFLPCFFNVGDWTTHEYVDVVNEGAAFSNKAIRFAGLAADPTEQFVAAAMLQAAPKIIDDVQPDPNAITMSRAYRLQQTGDGRDIPVWVPQVLTAEGPKVQDGQEKSKVSDKGRKLPSVFALNLVGETLMSCGEYSSPSADTEMINIDQMEFPDPSNHLECYTQYEDDNRTRHYVRRGLRNCGNSVTQNPTGETIPVKDMLATFSKTSSYERDGLPYYEKKVNSWSSHSTRSIIPGDSNALEDHPLSSPEGSLLHSLYLQLLAAGREGISLRGLYASFESQTSLPRFASNWREKVKTHLKNGPYFEEVKGRYILCEFLVQPSSKRISKKERSESLGVQTRRKAHQKTHEAVFSASAQAFQKLQRQKINDGGSGPPIPSLPNEAIRSDPDFTQQTLTKCISPPIRLTKPVNEGSQISRNIRFGGAIPGSLKAMKARIIAETGVQVGVRCARKDGSNDSSKWQCPMMAMEGHTLCEHHRVLNERKRARYAKARRQGDRKIGKSLRRHLQEKPAVPGVARSQRKNHGSRSSEAPRSELQNSDNDDPTRLDEFASQALLTMKSDILVVEKLNQDNPLFVPDLNPFQVDGSRLFSAESTKAKTNLAPYFLARSPTGRFIAAKKTGVKIPALSLVTGTSLGTSNVSSTLPPIPSLPEFYGPRKKTVKNRSLLSIN